MLYADSDIAEPVKVSAPAVLDAFVAGKPQRTATWRVPPTIRVCTDSGVSVTRAARATRYWEKLGYTFDGILGDPFSMCMTPKFGEILITIPETGFMDTHMASTRLYSDKKTGEIVKAKIFILPKNGQKDRVLEHEIGHALGWAHYRQRYHIMHPTWALGGWDSYGVRKR
jgi:hypothetical protein